MHGDKAQLPPISHQGLAYLSLLPDAAVTCTKQRISKIGPQTKSNWWKLTALPYKYSQTFHVDITVVIRIITGGLQIHPCYAWKGPAGTWRENDVVLMSMRRDFAPTLIWRHFRTKCPLGRRDSHCTFLSESTFYWILKVKRRDWLACSNAQANLRMDNTHIDLLLPYVRIPPLSISTKHPSIGIPHKLLSTHPPPRNTH